MTALGFSSRKRNDGLTLFTQTIDPQFNFVSNRQVKRWLLTQTYKLTTD